MTDHIMKAELRIAQMQERQLAAAEASPVAKAALWEARTRAVLRVAARLNIGVTTLHDLHAVMADGWSIERERAGEMGEAAAEWDVSSCCVDGYSRCEIEIAMGLVEDLWPDVVLGCEEFARRALT